MAELGESGRFITDEHGNRVAVIVQVQQYETLLEAMEELEEIRAYDAAKASGDESVDFEQAVREIERGELGPSASQF